MSSKMIVAGLFAAMLSVSVLPARAAEEDADAALYRAAMLHRGGDTPAALAIWRAWAERGNVDAAYNLAVIHQHADGVAYDPVAAARWYRQAAEGGDLVSQFQLGLMYKNGEGVAADETEAHAWFTRNRRAHMHHHHGEQYRQWQKQAQALIEERDRRESALAARRDGARVLAELRRRAGLDPRPAAVGALAAVATDDAR